VKKKNILTKVKIKSSKDLPHQGNQEYNINQENQNVGFYLKGTIKMVKLQ
jgi:hypothetical protein